MNTLTKHEALAQAVRMLIIIKDGGSFNAVEYIEKLDVLEKALADLRSDAIITAQRTVDASRC